MGNSGLPMYVMPSYMACPIGVSSKKRSEINRCENLSRCLRTSLCEPELRSCDRCNGLTGKGGFACIPGAYADPGQSPMVEASAQDSI